MPGVGGVGVGGDGALLAVSRDGVVAVVDALLTPMASPIPLPSSADSFVQAGAKGGISLGMGMGMASGKSASDKQKASANANASFEAT